jgi:hypothetical protein
MENQTLNTKIEVFTHTLHLNGIPVPEVSASPSIVRTNSTSEQDILSTSSYALSYQAHSSGGDSVSIDLTDLESMEPKKWCSTTAAYEEPRHFENPPSVILSDDHQSFLTFPAREMTQEEHGPAVTLGAQAGIDFILE